ncbi:hypothetical protein SDRG_14379 [Saprolegnia diclina VS20]|uniref:15-cis-phytoene synthase n=1 Tax=Saprolegnia diclina (strain VS20) TaxID=1156394 RepID=T0Q314_SAPDV|nr:hypothetical protein SDRG_14379 [Saprolegnia diclina VS20]EQC27795.1 hypothetical protein SDRG_14379 [Saprolegnia diclina VS20]|eukprot:XP_008618725.1 hypothetical protein SDRG_14379 [Saprolegnia diclina VS20]
MMLRGLQRRSISSEAMGLRDSVRNFDYDNFLCALLLPSKAQDAYFALRAFNIEIAKIKDSVRTNPGAGRMRIHWWRQRIHDIYTSPKPVKDHFLLAELQSAIQRHNLTQRWFDRILEARELDLEMDQPETLLQLEHYAEKTASSLLYLALECVDVRDDTADVAAQHAGMAVGMTTLLRGTVFHAKHNHVYLPKAVLEKHGLEAYDVLQGLGDDPALGAKCAPAAFDVACTALNHLRSARDLKGSLPKAAVPVFYATVPTQLFLDKLEATNFNLFDETLHESRPQKLQLQLLKHSVFRYF